MTLWGASGLSSPASARDVLLFVVAFRIAMKAQTVGSKPLPSVVDALMLLKGIPRCSSLERATGAAVRAGNRTRRWFGKIDTCLTRSLVAGRLLTACGAVVLHVGFRPGEVSGLADGHAWLTVGEQKIEMTSQLVADKGEFTTTLALPFVRRKVVGER